MNAKELGKKITDVAVDCAKYDIEHGIDAKSTHYNLFSRVYDLVLFAEQSDDKGS